MLKYYLYKTTNIFTGDKDGDSTGEENSQDSKSVAETPQDNLQVHKSGVETVAGASGAGGGSLDDDNAYMTDGSMKEGSIRSSDKGGSERGSMRIRKKKNRRKIESLSESILTTSSRDPLVISTSKQVI